MIESNEPFQVGAYVEVRPEELPRILKAVARKVTGRTGIVERCFIPLGARDWRVRLQWLHKNGRTKLDVDYWDARQLRAKPALCGNDAETVPENRKEKQLKSTA
jgi:hypothetical protein